jgi:hypothetical protein
MADAVAASANAPQTDKVSSHAVGMKWLEDGAELPALSPSIARALVAECPRQAWAEHRLLGDCISISEDALKRREKGKALHNFVLEGGGNIEVIPEANWRSKAAKEARDVARAAGMIPILEDTMTEIEAAAMRIIIELDRELGVSLEEGVAEKKFHWYEESSIGPVLCSGVIDWHDPETGRIVDLKTTEGSVRPEKCGAAVAEGSAVIQDCAYRNALCYENPELQGRTSVDFLFAQSKEPFMVTPGYCDGSLRHIGETRWLRAVETWAKCLAAGRGAKHWPPHTDKPVQFYAPPWVLKQEMELEAMEQ